MPSKDPEYQKKYIKKHYQLNKDYYKIKSKERKGRVLPLRRSILNRYKIIKGCIDCGYREHSEALDFDHVNGEKKFNVSRALNNMTSWVKIKREVAKCEVRCANCHRIATSLRRKSVALSS